MMPIDIKKLQEAQDEPVRNLAFSGGGAKGGIFVGALKALESVMPEVKGVAGSSAGAMTAAFVASGTSTTKLDAISRTTNFQALLGDGFVGINHDGKPLYELIKSTILSNVSDFIQNNNVADLCAKRIAQLNKDIAALETKEQGILSKQAVIHAKAIELMQNETKSLEVLDKLEAQALDIAEDLEILDLERSKIEESLSALEAVALNQSVDFGIIKKICAQGAAMSFKDLALMEKIDPTTFKGLSVTASVKDTSELVIFNAKNTPETDIARAVHASAAFPVVFAPVEIDGKQYIDGGWINNVPTELENFTDVVINPEKQSARTLALAFGKHEADNSLHKALFGSQENINNDGWLKSFMVDGIFKRAAGIGGDFEHIKSEEKLKHKLRADALNVVTLDPIDVSTFSFKEAQEGIDLLSVAGELQTLRHLVNHGLVEDSVALNEREFLFDVLVDTKHDSRAWFNSSTKGSMGAKTKTLLSFCNASHWEGKNKVDVLKEFVLLAGIDRATGNISSNTSTIKHIAQSLNKKTTPQDVVKEFRSLTEKTDGALFTANDFDKVTDFGSDARLAVSTDDAMLKEFIVAGADVTKLTPTCDITHKAFDADSMMAMHLDLPEMVDLAGAHDYATIAAA